MIVLQAQVCYYTITILCCSAVFRVVQIMKKINPHFRLWRIWLWNHTSHTKVSMNLLQMSCMITWTWSFWPPRLWRLLLAKNIISWCILWHFNSVFSSSLSASSAYQRFTKKFYQLRLSASIQPPYLKL